MGIVLKQSLSNTAVTYAGFAIGAVNTLFLYTRFLSEEYYGLVGVLLSTAAILTPVMAFGVPNSLVKFYSNFQDGRNRDGFLSLMLLLPLVCLIPLSIFSFAANEAIGRFLSHENAIVKDYVWYIFLIGMAMAYFEVFFAWSKVQMKSVFGNFMKEIFVRLGQTILLLLLYLGTIGVDTFLFTLVILYLLRTLIMQVYAHSLKPFTLNLHFPGNTRDIVGYSATIILGGSAAVMILEIDRFMINLYIPIANVAYYSVATYIAMVIAVPSRAMHQITYPLTAEMMNDTRHSGLEILYKRSSLTLYIISGLLFVLIILNINDLYTLLPENYRGGFAIIVLIGLTKIYDALLGNNNSILYNSDHYRDVLLMGVLLAVLTVLLNLWLIPAYGLNGAAIATFCALVIYNTIKLVYVKFKFQMIPFTIETLWTTLLLVVVGIPLYFLSFDVHPVVNMAIRSVLMCVLFVFALYRFRISEDIRGLLTSAKWWK